MKTWRMARIRVRLRLKAAPAQPSVRLPRGPPPFFFVPQLLLPLPSLPCPRMSTIVALSALLVASAAISGANAQTSTSVAPLADQTYAYSALVCLLLQRHVGNTNA